MVYRHAAWPVLREGHEKALASILARRQGAYVAARGAVRMLSADLSATRGEDAASWFATEQRSVGSRAELEALLARPDWAVPETMAAFAAAVRRQAPPNPAEGAVGRTAAWRTAMQQVRGYRLGDAPLDHVEKLFSAYRNLAANHPNPLPESDQGRGILAAMISWRVPLGDSLYDIVLAWQRAGFGTEKARWALRSEASDFYEWVNAAFTPLTGITDARAKMALRAPHLLLHEKLGKPRLLSRTGFAPGGRFGGPVGDLRGGARDTGADPIAAGRPIGREPAVGGPREGGLRVVPPKAGTGSLMPSARGAPVLAPSVERAREIETADTPSPRSSSPDDSGPLDAPVRLGLVYDYETWPGVRDGYETALASSLAEDPRALEAATAGVRMLHQDLSARFGDAASWFATERWPVGSAAELERLLSGPEWGVHETMDALATAVGYVRSSAGLQAPGERDEAWREQMRESRGYRLADEPLDRLTALFSVYRESLPDSDGRWILGAAIGWRVLRPHQDPLYDVVSAWEQAGYGAGPGAEPVRSVLTTEAGDLYEWADRTFVRRADLADPQEAAALTQPHLQVHDHLVAPSIPRNLQEAAGPGQIERTAGEQGLTLREVAALLSVDGLEPEGIDPIADLEWQLARRAAVRLDQDQRVVYWARWWSAESSPATEPGEPVAVPPVHPVWGSAEDALARVERDAGPGRVELYQVEETVQVAGRFAEAAGLGELYYILDGEQFSVAGTRADTDPSTGGPMAVMTLESPVHDESSVAEMSVDGSDDGVFAAAEPSIGAMGRGGLRGGSRDTGVDPLRAGWPIGREFTVEGPRHGGLTEVPAPAPAGTGKSAERWFTYERPLEFRSVPVRYEVSDVGRVRLPDGRTLSSDGWLRFGDDFFHGPTGALLRGDSGWVGQVANADRLREVLGAPGFEVTPYTLVGGPSGIHLTPVEAEGGPAVLIPLSDQTAPLSARPVSAPSPVDPVVVTGPSEEGYADRLASLLAGDPVDQSAVVEQLHLRRSLGDDRTAESLDAAFRERTGGTSLAEAMDDAVAEGRAPETLVEDVLRMLGLVSEFTLGAPPPGPIAVAPKTSPASLPQVQAFVGNLHTVLVEHEDAEGAFALLRLLGEDLPQAWAVQEAYQARYGASIDRHLNDLWEREHGGVAWHRWAEVWPLAAADSLFGETRPEPVSYAQVGRWYDLLTDLSFQHHELGAVRVPTDHVADGCYLRAHLVALRLLQWGAPVGKITVTAAGTDGWGLGLRSGDLPGSLDPVRIPWQYHIAAVVWAHDAEGRPEWMVLDPALGRGPLTAGEWLTAIGVDPGNDRNLFLTGALDDVQKALWEEFDKAPASWWFSDRVSNPIGRAVAVITEAHAESHPLQYNAGNLVQADANMRERTGTLVQHAVAMRELRYARYAGRVLEELRSAGTPAEEAALRLETELGGASPRRGTLVRYADLDRSLREVLGERYDDLTHRLFPPEEDGQEPSVDELADALARTSLSANAGEVTVPSETVVEEPSPVPSPPPDWPRWTSAPQARPATADDIPADLTRPEDADTLPESPVRFGHVYDSPSWASARTVYERTLGRVLAADPELLHAARDAARRLYATLARRMGADAAAGGFRVASGTELERLLGEDSEWTLQDVMTGIYEAVHYHHAALTELWKDVPRAREQRSDEWRTEMRDVRGYHVHLLPPDQTEWLFRVYRRLGFGPDHHRLFLQAAISWGTAMSQPLFDVLRAGLGGDPRSAVLKKALSGEAADLYAWTDEELGPRERTGDRELLADLTPPHLLTYDAPASAPAEGADEGTTRAPWSPALRRRIFTAAPGEEPWQRITDSDGELVGLHLFPSFDWSLRASFYGGLREMTGIVWRWSEGRLQGARFTPPLTTTARTAFTAGHGVDLAGRADLIKAAARRLASLGYTDNVVLVCTPVRTGQDDLGSTAHAAGMVMHRVTHAVAVTASGHFHLAPRADGRPSAWRVVHPDGRTEEFPAQETLTWDVPASEYPDAPYFNTAGGAPGGVGTYGPPSGIPSGSEGPVDGGLTPPPIPFDADGLALPPIPAETGRGTLLSWTDPTGRYQFFRGELGAGDGTGIRGFERGARAAWAVAHRDTLTAPHETPPPARPGNPLAAPGYRLRTGQVVPARDGVPAREEEPSGEVTSVHESEPSGGSARPVSATRMGYGAGNAMTFADLYSREQARETGSFSSPGRRLGEENDADAHLAGLTRTFADPVITERPSRDPFAGPGHLLGEGDGRGAGIPGLDNDIRAESQRLRAERGPVKVQPPALFSKARIVTLGQVTDTRTEGGGRALSAGGTGGLLATRSGDGTVTMLEEPTRPTSARETSTEADASVTGRPPAPQKITDEPETPVTARATEHAGGEVEPQAERTELEEAATSPAPEKTATSPAPEKTLTPPAPEETVALPPSTPDPVRETGTTPAPPESVTPSVPTTALGRAREVLAGLPEERRAEVMGQASMLVGDLSGRVPSLQDPGGRVPWEDWAGLRVAAEIARTGPEAGERLARELTASHRERARRAISTGETVPSTPLGRARQVLAGLTERRRAEVMGQAATFVGDLSGRIPSVRDSGGEASRVDQAGLLVAAEIARSGAAAGEALARRLMYDLDEPLVPRVLIDGARENVARTTIDLLRGNEEADYPQIRHEARLIIRRLTGIAPDDESATARGLQRVLLLTEAEIAWAGHRAAADLAADILGLPRLPDTRVLDELTSAGRFDLGRARATLGLLSDVRRAQLRRETAAIVRAALIGSALERAPRDWRELIAAEIARSGHTAGEDLARDLVLREQSASETVAKTQWGKAGDRTVALWLPGQGESALPRDVETLSRLSEVVPEGMVLVVGEAQDGLATAREQEFKAYAMAKAIEKLAPGLHPLLAMNNGASVAEPVSRALNGPVVATPYEAMFDRRTGDLLSRPSGDTGTEEPRRDEWFRMFIPGDREGLPVTPGLLTSVEGERETKPVVEPDPLPFPPDAEAEADGEAPPAPPGPPAPTEPSEPAVPAGSVEVTPVTVDPMVVRAGVPREDLPQIMVAVARIRQELDRIGAHYTQEDVDLLPQRLLANFPHLHQGLQVPMGDAEVLVRLDATDPQKVQNPGGSTRKVSDLPPVEGEHTAGGTVNSVFATGAHTQSVSGQTGATRGAISLSFGIGATPFALQVVRVGVSLSGTANQSNRSLTHIADAEGGHVEVAGGGHTLLAYTGHWSFQVRRGPGGNWDTLPVHRVDDPTDEKLLVWVPDNYLGTAPAQVTATGDAVKTGRLPAYFFASGLSHLPELFDATMAELRQRGLDMPVGGQLRKELLQKLWNLNMHLDAAVNNADGGYQFDLHNEYGRPVATVSVRSELLAGTARVGATSKDSNIENVRTLISGSSGGHSITNSSTLTFPSVDFGLQPFHNTDVGMGVSFNLSYSSSNTDSISAGKVGLFVVVPRYVGHTSAYRMSFRHRVTVSVRGRAQPGTTRPIDGNALVRVPEPMAYEHGLPVDAEALKGAQTGGTRPYAEGDIRRLGKREMPADPADHPAPPPWLKDAKGVGTGLPFWSEGTIQRVQDAVKTMARRYGFLPARADHPFADYSRFGHGNKLDSLADIRRQIEKFASDRGLSSHFDQLHQDGMVFTLKKRRGGMGVDWDVDSMKVTITARGSGSAPRYLGSAEDYRIVNLVMGMSSAGMSVSHSRKIALGFKVRGLYQVLKGAVMGLEYQRSAGASDAMSVLTNLPQLMEFDGPTHEFEVTRDLEIKFELQHSGRQGRVLAGRRNPPPITLPGETARVFVLPVSEEGGPTSSGPTPARAGAGCRDLPRHHRRP
ncbi:hypothetical protein GCM10029978_061820 [Actinoallomurus acanthiterrae]